MNAKKIFTLLLIPLILIGCTNKKSDIKKNYYIKKDIVKSNVDKPITSLVLENKIYSLSYNSGLENPELIKLEKDESSQVKIDENIKVNTLFINPETYCIAEESDNFSSIYSYNTSGDLLYKVNYDHVVSIINGCTDQDNNLYVLAYSYIDPDIYLYIYDNNGNELSTINITDKQEMSNYTQVNNIAVDNNKNIYLITTNQDFKNENQSYSLLKFNNQFTELINKTELNDIGNNINTLFINSDNTLILSGYDEQFAYINCIDPKTDETKKIIEIPDTTDIYNGKPGYLVCKKNDKILLYDIALEKEEVISETSSDVFDINSNNNEVIICQGNDNISLRYTKTDCENNFLSDKIIYPKDFMLLKDTYLNSNGDMFFLYYSSDFSLHAGKITNDNYCEYNLSTKADTQDNNYIINTNAQIASVNDNLVYCLGDNIYFFNIKTGLEQKISENFSNIKDLCIYKDILTILYDNLDSLSIAEYSLSNNKINNTIITEFNNKSKKNTIISGDTNYDYYINADDKLYGFKSHKKKELLDWSYLYGQMYITSLSVIGNDKYLCISEDEKPYFIEKTDTKPTEMLSVALFGMTTASFNEYLSKLQGEYEFNIKPYNNYDDGGDRGFKQFNLDIASGVIPDVIISQGYTSLDLYREKGLMESLNNYIEEDNSVNKEDYLKCIFDLNKINGELYYLTPSFTVKSLLSTESISDNNSMTCSDFYSYLNSNKYNNEAFGGEQRVYIFNWLLSVYSDSLFSKIDGKMICDNKELRAILELSKKYALNTKGFPTQESSMKSIKDGKQKFYLNHIINFNSYNLNKKVVFDNHMSLFSISPDASANMGIEFENTLSITSKSQNKESAWNFIKHFIQEDYQNLIINENISFPVKKSSLDNSLKNSMSRKSREKFGVTYDCISNNEAQELISNIENCTLKLKMDATLMKIMDEESIDYFEDKASLEDTIKRIESKVNLYFSEIGE